MDLCHEIINKYTDFRGYNNIILFLYKHCHSALVGSTPNNNNSHNKMGYFALPWFWTAATAALSFSSSAR